MLSFKNTSIFSAICALMYRYTVKYLKKEFKFYFCFGSSFLYKLSTPIAPNGAVSKIDTTATVRTISPHANPIVNGIVPIAACTVAFGVYAIAQNSRSFEFNFVFVSDSKTPTIRRQFYLFL